jgi:hypothetical protein
VSSDLTELPHVSLPIFLSLKRIHELGVGQYLFKITVFSRAKEANMVWLGAKVRIIVIKGFELPFSLECSTSIGLLPLEIHSFIK